MAVTLPTQGGDSGTWGTELNAFITGCGACYLGEVAAVDLNTATAKTTLYTVPASHKAIISHVLIMNPSASLAGCTDVDFGSGATCTTWVQNVDLSGMTATSDYRLMVSTGIFTVEDAADTFGIYVNTASSGAATARIIVFGMEIAA